MKKWFHKLNAIDFLALGIGICLTIAYILYKDVFNQDSPWLDIWPNISTEILGIWVSVRIIDSLIEAREKKTSIRNAIIGGFNYFLDNTKQMKPEYYDWKVQALQDELKWFKKKYPKREKYLYKDERELVKEIVELENQISLIANSYSQKRNRLLVLKTDFSIAFNKAGEIRSDFEKQLRDLEHSMRKDSFEGFPDFSSLIVGKESNFSRLEIETVKSEYERMKARIGTNDYERIDWWELIPTLHRGNSFKLIESEYDKLREIWDYPETKVIDTITQIESSNDFENYPPILFSIGIEFSTIVKELASLRIKIDKQIDILDEMINKFTVNVLEETDTE